MNLKILNEMVGSEVQMNGDRGVVESVTVTLKEVRAEGLWPSDVPNIRVVHGTGLVEMTNV